MATSGPVDWQELLKKNAPELFKQVMGFQESALKRGALPIKTKTLMILLCNAVLGHSDGVAIASERARSLGASEAEITETIELAFWIGGFPAVVNGAFAFLKK